MTTTMTMTMIMNPHLTAGECSAQGHSAQFEETHSTHAMSDGEGWCGTGDNTWYLALTIRCASGMFNERPPWHARTPYLR